MKLAIAAAVLAAGVMQQAARQAPPPPPPDPLEHLAQQYLWPASDADRRAAETAITGDGWLRTMTRERFHDLEEAMRRGRPSYPPAPARGADGKFALIEMTVDVPAGPPVPMIV